MKGVIPKGIKFVRDDQIPEEVYNYAYSILDVLFEDVEKFPRPLPSKLEIEKFLRDRPNRTWMFRLVVDYSVQPDGIFYQTVEKLMRKKIIHEYVYPIGQLFTITLNNWKQHQILSRLKELEQTVQQQSNMLNKMTIMLESIMPGGVEKIKF